MKKIIFSILISFFVLFPVSVLADGYISVSPSSLTIEQGSTKTFTITAYNAIGDVTIKSSNTGIATVNQSSWGTGMVDEKQTKKGTITVSGKNIGTTTIKLTLDAATFDGDDLAGQNKVITVTVVEKKPAPVYSKNNKIKSISVDGHQLVKVNDNNYTLTVLNNVTSIKLNATLEDDKAKISGTGSHTLKVGENNIEVVVTSESGDKNKINVKVTRKDGYYLEDLDVVLKDNSLKDIILYSDSKVTKEHINKIINSKKTINLNYYDNNKKLVYSWIVNGSEVKEGLELNSKVTFVSENKKEISKLSNYADGLYLNFDHKGKVPEKTKFKLYVGDKFEDGNAVKVYQFDNSNKALELFKDNLKVTSGYIEFDIENCSEYFVTMSVINNLEENDTDNNVTSGDKVDELDNTKEEKDSSIDIFMITTIISVLINIGLVLFICTKLKTKRVVKVDKPV